MQSRNPLITDVAESVPFDNETNGFSADQTQSAIEEIDWRNLLYIGEILTTGGGDMYYSSAIPLMVSSGQMDEAPEFIRIAVRG
jgi:hypothetical protein